MPRHGHASGRSQSPTYVSWSNMIQRCCNSNNPDYKYYGAKGVTVCPAWRNSFEAFLGDMGDRPTGTTLDRRDPDGDYTPDNCRWLAKEFQNHNRSDTVFTVGKRLEAEQLRKEGLTYAAIASRIGLSKGTVHRYLTGVTWK